MSPDATIAAIATAPGRGGIGIVRVSGRHCCSIAEALLGRVPAPRTAELHRFRDAIGEPIDEGIALYFPAPASFTGEDVLELHGHGGPLLMDLLLRRVLELGARAAEPGEFTERAFLNDKLDLSQAEAVADLIDSGSVQAARAALRSLQGEFSSQVHDLAESVLALRMWVEERADRVCKEAIAAFDRVIPLYYDREDRERGYIEAKDRFGTRPRFPILSLSIATVVVTVGRFRQHQEVARVAAELKQRAKRVPGSVHLVDDGAAA